MIPIHISKRPSHKVSPRILPDNGNSFLLKKLNEDIEKEKSNNQTIDLFLSKAGKTSYHTYLFIALILIFMADGAEMVVIAMTIDSVSKEFDLELSEKGLLGSIVFLGLLIGSLSASKFCDKYGRKEIIKLGAFTVALFAILTAVTPNFIFLLLFRFILGAGVGLVIPSSTSLVSESVPAETRSFYLNNIWVAFPIGEMYVYFICSFFNEKELLNWRWVMGLSSIPSFIAFFLLLNIKESPRFLILNDKVEEGFAILDEIASYKNMKLSEIEKKMIVMEIKECNTNKIEMSFYSLISSSEYKSVSMQIWAIWLLISIVFYGGLYIFPQILSAIQKEEKTVEYFYFDLIFTSIFYTPVTVVAGYISEIPSLGRKYSIMFGFLLCFIVCLYCVVFESFSFLSYTILRFGIGISFSVIGVYTSEIYPTRIRTIGNSAGNACTRIGGIIAPFLMELFFENFGHKSPIIVFTLCSGIGAYITYTLMIETHQKSLDFCLKNELNKQKMLI